MSSVDENNLWRLESPGAAGWGKSVKPGAADKYTMISCDTHAVEPVDLLLERGGQQVSRPLAAHSRR